MSLDSADRKNKIRFISNTMTGFYSIMRNLQEDYRTYSGNFSEEALALLSKSYGFTESADAIRTLGSLDRIDDEGIDELFGLSQQIVELYHLEVQPEIQNTETDVSSLNYTDKSENAILETFDSEVKLTEIIYFLNNYKSVANWEYNGHGSFIAKKNATIWELGGIYWNKLFELPPNPDLIHIGDEIHLKQEVIDTIFEVSTSGVTGEYTFDPKSPEAKELIFSVISFCADSSDSLPKIVKYGFTGKNVKDAKDTFTKAEETASKLSYFIQQYSTEGQEEDAWKKIISVASFLGPVFSFLGLLSNASVEENKYQIVQYNQRKAFLNSAKDEIVRIKELQSNVKEEHLETEINYLRFLKKQLKMITEEIRLNKERDLQQLNEIRFYTSQHASSKDWKDTRSVKSSANFHNIDYHKLFEEQK